MESALRTLGVSEDSVPKVTQCWGQPEGTCDPGQAWFSASLMLSQVLHSWIGSEVVLHSPEVLRSRGESSRDLEGVHRLRTQVDPNPTILMPIWLQVPT